MYHSVFLKIKYLDTGYRILYSVVCEVEKKISHVFFSKYKEFPVSIECRLQGKNLCMDYTQNCLNGSVSIGGIFFSTVSNMEPFVLDLRRLAF